MSKFVEKAKARRLRTEGYSVRYITKRLGVSKGSVSRWCRDIDLTESQRAALEKNRQTGNLEGRTRAAESKREARLARIEAQRQAGMADFPSLTDREFFAAGVGIYWGEGSKTDGLVNIGNSDPQVIIFMLKWLEKFADVSINDIACQLGINELYVKEVPSIEKYWSETIGIPIKQFTKTSIKHVKNKKLYPDRGPHKGTLRIQVHKSTNLQRKIMGWIEGMYKAA